jgi:hypothetical protein
MIDVEEQISVASASIISLSVIAFTSLLFGLIIGLGFAYTSAMDTSDQQTKGFVLLMVGFVGFLITIGITIIKGERRRSRIIASHQGF